VFISGHWGMVIKDYNSFLETKSGKLYEFGCVMAYLDIKNWNNIISKYRSI
jgi:hypothetical protein